MRNRINVCSDYLKGPITEQPGQLITPYKLIIMKGQAIIAGFSAVVIGLFYEFFLKDILFISIGVGRIIQPIEDFPYSCHKIYGPENILESCEDLWLDDEGRTLYGACVDLKSRHQWSPG